MAAAKLGTWAFEQLLKSVRKVVTSPKDVKHNAEVLNELKRRIVNEPERLKAWSKHHGITEDEMLRYLNRSIKEGKGKLKQVKAWESKELTYNGRYGDKPDAPGARAAYMEKEKLKADILREPPNTGKQLRQNKQQAMNDLALQIEERKNDLRLAGSSDPARPKIQQQIEEMERRLDLMEQGAENPNLPKQKITYSNNAAGQARKEEQVKQLSASKPDSTPETSRVNPSLKEVREQAALPLDTPKQPIDKYEQRYGLQTPPPAMVVHDDFMDAIDGITDRAKLEAMLKARLQKQAMGGKDRKYSKYAMDQINKEVGILQEKIKGIDPALENDALMNQWSNQGYAAGGLVSDTQWQDKHDQRWQAFIDSQIPMDQGEHTSSYGQMSPELRATLEARDYKDFSPPEGPEPDASDRLLAIREGLGSIPGLNAELLGILGNSPIAATIDHFTPESEKWNVIPEMMDQAARSADRAYMLNPDYMNDERSVHPKSTDEAVGYYGSWALDPIGWVGLKGGPALKIPQAKPKEFMRLSDRIQNAGRKMQDPDLPKGARNKAAKEYDQLLGELLERKPPTEERRVNPQAIDESRRQFLKGSAAATGVGAVGGIAGLKYATKGAEAAKTPTKLLSFDEWLARGRPKGQIPDYMKTLGKDEGMKTAWKDSKEAVGGLDASDVQIYLDEGVDQMRYNNYLRSMHKEIGKGEPGRGTVDHARNIFREQMYKREALLDEQAQMQRRADIAKIKQQARENVEARGLSHAVEPGKYKHAVWKEIDDLMSKDIKNYNLMDDELIDMHRGWGTDTETAFKDVMANNPQSKMRLKDVDKALTQ